MEREVSLMTELMIGLVALSAFLFIVFGTISISRSLQEDAVSTTTDVKETLSVSYLRDIERGEVDSNMPSATAYNIMTSYEDSIVAEASDFDDKVRVVSVDSSVLETHLKGRVNIQVKEVASGQFAVILTMIDETMPQSYIDNKTQVGVNTLKTKYGM